MQIKLVGVWEKGYKYHEWGKLYFGGIPPPIHTGYLSKWRKALKNYIGYSLFHRKNPKYLQATT